MRMHGEPPGRLFFSERKTKLRPLILILDVSGSMADYSRHLLQFAHTARHSAARVEVFCFGTRLTRITRELARQRIDAALEEAARTVVDWDGGVEWFCTFNCGPQHGSMSGMIVATDAQND